MAKETKVETTSVCDVCRKVGRTDHHGMPEGWREIKLTTPVSHYGNHHDALVFEGIACNECCRGFKHALGCARRRDHPEMIQSFIGIFTGLFTKRVEGEKCERCGEPVDNHGKMKHWHACPDDHNYGTDKL